MNNLLAVDEDRGRLAGLASILLALFVYVLLSRYTGWAAGVKFLISAIAAAAVLAPSVGLDRTNGPPPGWLSAMLVAGFALATIALGELADLLGANTGDLDTSTVTWIALLLAVGFGLIAQRRDSAICLLLAAVALVVGIATAVDWIFSPDGATTFRWVFLIEGLALVAAGVALYRDRGRHGVVLVALGGIAVLAIAATFLGEGLFFSEGESLDGISGWWELVTLAFGLGLAAFAVHTREPGPGYVAGVLLVVFTVMQAQGVGEKFVWWPLLLLLAAGGAVALFLSGAGPRTGGAARGAPAETTRETTL